MSAETNAFACIGEKRQQPYGLIDPNRVNDYRFSVDDSSMLDAFEALLEQSDHGAVKLGDAKIRLAHYLEGHNEIRSIVICDPDHSDGPKTCIATSIITDSAGETFIEEHLSLESGEEVIKEPRVGSSVVVPANYDGLLLFSHVAYEATPLRQAA